MNEYELLGMFANIGIVVIVGAIMLVALTGKGGK